MARARGASRPRAARPALQAPILRRPHGQADVPNGLHRQRGRGPWLFAVHPRHRSVPRVPLRFVPRRGPQPLSDRRLHGVVKR